MNPNQATAFRSLQQAQQALKAGDKTTARLFAGQAVQAAPELEEVWLMMAALAQPQASVQYLQRALQINPGSERAQKGMAWAMERLRKASARRDQQPPASFQQQKQTAPLETAPPARLPKTQAASVVERTQPAYPVPSPIEAQPEKRPTTKLPVSRPQLAATAKHGASQKPSKRRRIPFIPLLAFLLCAVIGGVIWWSATPPAAFFKRGPGALAWAQVEFAKPTQTLSQTPTVTFTATTPPTAVFTVTGTFTATPSPWPSPTITKTPTASETPTPTETPSITPTEEATPTPLPTDTAIPTRIVPTDSPVQQVPHPGAGGERWIDVNLSQQMVYAYEGDTLIQSFVVSTGTWLTPTVIGQYRIYIKYRYKDMSGPGYYLKNVPYTMFFYKGYALHGTYWHNNFGTPMSRGCINLTISDSEWLYNFASVGTLVSIHY